jgi:hypothetical protein
MTWIDASHNPEVAGSILPRYLKGLQMHAFFMHANSGEAELTGSSQRFTHHEVEIR